MSNKTRNEINKKEEIQNIEAYNISLLKSEPLQAIYNTSDYNAIFNYNYWDDYYKNANERIEKYKELISEFASKYQNLKLNYSDNNYSELKNIMKERFEEIEVALKDGFRNSIINKKDESNINDIMIDGLINIVKFVEKFKINIYEIYDFAYEKIRQKYINEFEIYDLFVGAYSTLYGINNENKNYFPFNLYFALFTKFIEFLDERTIAINYNLNFIKKYANNYKKAYENLNNEKLPKNKIIENILFGNTFIDKLLNDSENENEGVFLEKFYYRIEYKDEELIRIKMPIEIFDYLFMIKKELVNLSNIYENRNSNDYLKVKELMDYISNALLPNIYLFKIPIKLNEISSSNIKNYVPYTLPNKIIGIYKEGDKYVFDITNLEEDDIYDLEPLLLFEHTIIHRTNSNGFIEKYKNILNLDQIYSRLINDLDLVLAFFIFDFKNTAQYANKLLFFENYLTPLAREIIKHINNLYKSNVKNIDPITIIRTCKFGNNYINQIAYDVIYAKYKKIYETKIKDKIVPEAIKSLFKSTINNLIFYFIDKELKNNGDVNKIAHFFKNVYFNLLEGDIEIYEPNIDEILQQNNLHKTYIPPIDDIIEGFRDGNLIIIGARPSIGKTSIALNIALNNLYYHPDYNIGLISLETSARALMYRALMIITKGKIGIKNPETNKYLISKEELQKYSDYYLSRLKIIDNANNLEAVLSAIKELKQKYDVKFVIIDYLQRIPVISNKGDLSNTYQGVSSAITKISELRKELNIPIIVLSQLSRNAEYKKGKLKMSYFRDSGMIENEADIAILMDKSPNSISDNEIICIVDKNRDGRIGEAILTFQKPIFYFADANIDYTNIKFDNNEKINILNEILNKENDNIENINIVNIANTEINDNYDYDNLLENKFKKQCVVCNKEFYTQFENYYLCYNCRVKKNYIRKKCNKCGSYFYTNQKYNICNDCLIKHKKEVKNMTSQSQNNLVNLHYIKYFADKIYDKIIDYINEDKIKLKNPKFKKPIIDFIAKNKTNDNNIDNNYSVLFDFTDDILYLIFSDYDNKILKNEINRLLNKNKKFADIKNILKNIRVDFNELYKILLIDDENLKIVNYEYYKNNIKIQQLLEKAYYELRGLLNEILNSNNNDSNKIVNKILSARTKFNNLLFKLFNYYYYLNIYLMNKNKSNKNINNKNEMNNKNNNAIKANNENIENKENIENDKNVEKVEIINQQIFNLENKKEKFYNIVYNYLAANILSQQILPEFENNNYKIIIKIDKFRSNINNYLNDIEGYGEKFKKAFDFIDRFFKFNAKFLNKEKYNENDLANIINEHYNFVIDALSKFEDNDKKDLLNLIYNIRFNYYYSFLNSDDYNILEIPQFEKHIGTFILQTFDILHKMIEISIYKNNGEINENEKQILIDFYDIYLSHYLKIINLIKEALKKEANENKKRKLIDELKLKKVNK